MKKRKLPPYFQRIILDFYSYTSDKHSEDDIFKVTHRRLIGEFDMHPTTLASNSAVLGLL